MPIPRGSNNLQDHLFKAWQEKVRCGSQECDQGNRLASTPEIFHLRSGKHYHQECLQDPQSVTLVAHPHFTEVANQMQGVRGNKVAFLQDRSVRAWDDLLDEFTELGFTAKKVTHLEHSIICPRCLNPMTEEEEVIKTDLRAGKHYHERCLEGIPEEEKVHFVANQEVNKVATQYQQEGLEPLKRWMHTELDHILAPKALRIKHHLQKIFECGICLELMGQGEVVTEPSGGHHFHKGCIQEYYARGANVAEREGRDMVSCPICRAPTAKGDWMINPHLPPLAKEFFEGDYLSVMRQLTTEEDDDPAHMEVKIRHALMPSRLQGPSHRVILTPRGAELNGWERSLRNNYCIRCIWKAVLSISGLISRLLYIVVMNPLYMVRSITRFIFRLCCEVAMYPLYFIRSLFRKLYS